MKPLEFKICGLTRLEDVEHAVNLGATALGFVFVPGKRLAKAELAQKVALKYPQILRVGVVQDPSLDEALQLVSNASLSAIQFHGAETREYISEFRDRVTSQFNGPNPFQIIRALNVDEALSVQSIQEWVRLVDLLLFDSPRPTGSSALDGSDLKARSNSEPPDPRPKLNLSLLMDRLEQSPHCRNFLIAGGLNAESVGEVLARLKKSGLSPTGVDVSSGVEASPGIKDSLKIKNFIVNAKGASRAI